MIEIIKELSVEVTKPNIFQALVAKQYDMNTRFLKVTLMDCGTRIDVPYIETAKVVINAERKDGQSKGFDGVINEDGTVTVPLHSWMLELEGTVICDISVMDTAIDNNKKLTTTSFTLLVEKAAYGGDDITSDPQFDVLVALLEAAPTAQEALEKSYEANAKYDACVEATENANKVREEIEAGGYIESLKEMNNGGKFSFWVGTTEEYNAIETKIPNCLYITTDEVPLHIGGTYVTQTNTNPTEIIGGEWELFSKGLKPRQWKEIGGTINKQHDTDMGCNYELNCYRSENCLKVLAKVQLKETINLMLTPDCTCGNNIFKINFENMGLDLSKSVGYDMPPSELSRSMVTQCDGQGHIEVIVDKDGYVTLKPLNDIKIIASGAPVYFEVVIPVAPSQMLDDECDKFYWVRTA